MKLYQSLLIANRGEIAVRIIRSASALGIKTIAVYSEADIDAPHVALADDAQLIGPAPVSDSYLNIDRIMAAAVASGAQAIHPGYGFLSENAGFSKAVEQAGLIFVGPPSDAIALMGDKAAAKRRMIQAGVPCVPGYEGEDQSDATLLTAADRIGFPVMVKACAGGGGRGMRLVTTADALADALSAARSEALNAFGSDQLIIEKAVERARHVEIQVFADADGNVIHLGERDCSVQRRHQKVVEEAPCPVMTDTLRARMGNAAVEAARSIHYRGAGTVEFLLDSDNSFYFLEMNTRLQVEHPVTEMVTGLDLVQMQLRVADGEALSITQDDLELDGHAIEVRLYAEDVATGFLPATGTVERWKPYEDDDTRVDSGIMAGQQVSPFYDPMLAKIITWGRTRDDARLNLIYALKESELFGVTTNRGFLIDILENQTFAGGQATTAFIGEEFSEEDLAAVPANGQQLALAAVLIFARERESALARSLAVPPALLNWSSGDPIRSGFRLCSGDSTYDVWVRPVTAQSYEVSLTDEAEVIDISDFQIDGDMARMAIGDRRRSVTFAHLPGSQLQICESGRICQILDVTHLRAGSAEQTDGGQVLAPMHGVLVELLVQVGDQIDQGDKLAVMEAMKMQHDLRAGTSGTIQSIRSAQGDQVGEGDLLIEIQSIELQDKKES